METHGYGLFCKAISDWEEEVGETSGYAFDENEFCKNHAPENVAQVVARRMFF